MASLAPSSASVAAAVSHCATAAAKWASDNPEKAIIQASNVASKLMPGCKPSESTSVNSMALGGSMQGSIQHCKVLEGSNATSDNIMGLAEVYDALYKHCRQASKDAHYTPPTLKQWGDFLDRHATASTTAKPITISAAQLQTWLAPIMAANLQAEAISASKQEDRVAALSKCGVNAATLCVEQDNIHTGLPVFATWTEGTTLHVVVQGTKVPRDWLINCACKPVMCGGAGAVHDGFFRSANALVAWLQAKHPDLKTRFTQFALSGHSAGAAVASVTGIILRENYGRIPVSVVALACPAVVSQSINAAIKADAGLSIISIVHGNDVVPRASLYSLMEACRSITGVAVSAQQRATHRLGPAGDVFLFREGQILSFQSLQDQHDDLERLLVRSCMVSDHMVSAIQAALDSHV